MATQYYLAGCELHAQSGHEAGRTLLVQLYREHVGTSMPEILTTSMGKPYFATGPWHFSITHTPRHAFCVLANSPVGIDAEEQDRPIRLSLAEKILSDAELARFHAADDPRQALLRLWVLKEADAKRTSVGIGFHPRHTDFSPDDPRIQCCDGCFVAVVL